MNMMTGAVCRRKNKYREYEDLIILKEVCASKANIAGHGHIGELFRKAVDRENLNPNQTRKLNAKSIQG